MSNKYENIIIEPITKKNTEQIIIMLHQEQISDLFANPTIEDYFNSNTMTYAIKLVEKNNKKLVGCVSATRLKNESTSLCLWGLYVNREYRSHGIASKALKQFIEMLMSLGTSYLYGICELNNNLALNFYKKRYLFLMKDNKTIGKLNDDLSNLSELYMTDGEVEVVFGFNHLINS